jgi:predicted RNase H-like HicB family nuclease
MQIRIKLDREDDGRWIADVPAVGGLLYGDSRRAAIDRAKECALEVLAGRIRAAEERAPDSINFVVSDPPRPRGGRKRPVARRGLRLGSEVLTP